jgi:hypothetical protein
LLKKKKNINSLIILHWLWLKTAIV